MAHKSLKSYLQSLSGHGHAPLPDPCVHPFIHRIKLNTKQKIQVAVMSFTVAPLRLVFVSLFFILTWILAYVVAMPMKNGSREPIGPIHSMFVNFVRCVARTALFFMGFHRIAVKGKQASPEDACLLIAAPHSSLLDAVVLFSCNQLPSTVAKAESAHLPFLGTILKVLQPIYVQRKDPLSRKNSTDEIARRAKSNGKWPPVVVFPEGTCTNRKVVVSFKTGSFLPGTPVQPVAIHYPNSVDTFTWTENGPHHATLFWFTLCQFENKSEVHFLPVYKPSDEETKNPKLYAENVRKRIADCLGLPCTNHSFEDVWLMRQAKKLGLPKDVGVVEYYSLRQDLGISVELLLEFLTDFADIVRDKASGLFSVEDYATFLSLPVTSSLQELFNTFGKDGGGEVSFPEYVSGILYLSQSVANGETLEQVLRSFDSGSNGFISREEFKFTLVNRFNCNGECDELFNKIRKDGSDEVSPKQLTSFLQKRPEYVAIFTSRKKRWTEEK